MEKEPIKNHQDLKVYQMAFDAAMKIFELSKK
ncbi:four helix bundle protein, partial [Nostoc sp. 'Peltigera membranacea cyanobiont' 232]